MSRILILIGGHISTAPRPQKEAETLSQAGHEVIVFGNWFGEELTLLDQQFMHKKKWRYFPSADFRKQFVIKNLSVRSASFFARWSYRRLKIFFPELLGYAVKAMLNKALKIHADLTIVHSEAGLWIGQQLLKHGFNVGVDFEDWFSEELSPQERIDQPISKLKEWESLLLKNRSYCLCASEAMAHALEKYYHCSKPLVIYNVFPWSDRDSLDHKILDRQDLNIPSLHWFSQTIGPGRGLETLFQALPHLQTTAEIHLRGQCSQEVREWIKRSIPDFWKKYLFIHPFVAHNELLSRIAEHDIGLALEGSEIPNRNLTVSNKLFQYMQVGLASIATDTLGQREILSQCPEMGRLVPCNNPRALAEAIDDLLQVPNKLIAAKTAALQMAKDKFNWEQQAGCVVRAVEKVLS